MRTYVQIKPEDNVAIAVKELPKGTEIMPGVITLSDIPQAHKIALTNIPKDGAVIRYGVTLGYALDPIAKGQWINEYMLRLPTPPSLDDMPWGINIRTDLPEPPENLVGIPESGRRLCGNPEHAGDPDDGPVRGGHAERGAGADPEGTAAEIPQCG